MIPPKQRRFDYVVGSTIPVSIRAVLKRHTSLLQSLLIEQQYHCASDHIMADIEKLADSYRSGALSGQALADMVTAGTLTKQERRKVVRTSSKPANNGELTERQKLRLAVKEKKALPKISKDERRQKFLNVLVEQKEQEREKDAANFTTCLGCRKRGHFLKDCPKNGQVANDEPVVDICFNCGETGHALRHCGKPRRRDGNLPFASCFICKRKGHISKDCPENPNGLYPKGGCCHICLQKTHLVRDCPERTEEDRLNFAANKQRLLDDEEDRTKGPRIGSVVSGGGGGDDEIDYGAGGDGDNDDGDDDGNEGEKKKKDKSSKKKRKSMS